MRFLFFLGPLCEGAPPAGGGGENLFLGDYDYIRQGRGHNVCLAVSRDGEHIDSKQCLLYNKDYPAGLTCHVRDPKVFAYEAVITWCWGPAQWTTGERCSCSRAPTGCTA